MNESQLSFACPVPAAHDSDVVLLAHGEGGLLSRRLIQQRISPRFANQWLQSAPDAAQLLALQQPVVISTDSFVVSPLFFPGGDIGKLSVFGTTNDLAMVGARPRFLTLSLIMEEGMPLATLDRVLDSIAQAANSLHVAVVAGDTKVVPRGSCDGLFINTTGLGEQLFDAPPDATQLVPGDVIIASGPIASHGMAVLNARDQMGFDPPPASDCASLWPAVLALHDAGLTPRALRDATRGGVTAVLHEWAEVCNQSLKIDEMSLPVLPQVRAACELLGLDPLHVANEGMMLVAIPPHQVESTLYVLRRASPTTAQATVIGVVEPPGTFPVTVRRALGRRQPLDEPIGAPLPRIC
jgi:hydrogenase expression/formation protein HypE